MPTADLREALGRWRNASSGDEKSSAISHNVRLFIISGASLLLLVMFLLGVQRFHASSTDGGALMTDDLIDDIFNSTLGVSPRQTAVSSI